MRVDLILKGTRFIYFLVSIYFYVFYINLIHAPAWPLLWWLYDDDTLYTMFKFRQNVLNVSEIKLVPVSDIFRHGD